jgi:hypothetical protein
MYNSMELWCYLTTPLATLREEIYTQAYKPTAKACESIISWLFTPQITLGTYLLFQNTLNIAPRGPRKAKDKTRTKNNHF